MNRYRQLVRYPLRHWPALLFILVPTALTSAAAALQPWPLKILVDYALGDTAVPASVHSFFEYVHVGFTPMALIIAAAIASLSLFLLNMAIDVSLTWAWASAGQRMVYDLSADLFHRLQRLSLLFHSRRTVGDFLNRLTSDTYCVYSLAGDVLITPAQQLLTLVSVGVVAWNMHPRLTVLSLAVAPVMAISSLFFGPHLKKRSRLNREAQSRIMSFVHQTLTAIPVVQAFNTERRNREHFQYLATDAVSRSQHMVLLKNSYGLVNGLITTGGAAVVLFAGGQEVLSGTLTVGSLLVFLAYLRSMQGGIKGLLGIYGSMKSVSASVDRVLELLEREDDVLDMPGARPLVARRKKEGMSVHLEEVTFGYESGSRVLDGTSLEAKPGETVALVGPTGAGKSTLVSLIPRFFDPWEGRVILNGIDVREVQLSSLRARIAMVLQEPFLMPLTVAENIAYGRLGASRVDIVSAAVAANADEFIRQLPKGYDTVIGERGATLSGGQRQRLAIARALLKDAPVLILDEPTSAVDAETEKQILEALERLMEGRTTFIVAHRLSTIRSADRIVVLEKGKVAETGTQRELLRAKGAFHHLYFLQFPRPSMGVAG